VYRGTIRQWLAVTIPLLAAVALLGGPCLAAAEAKKVSLKDEMRMPWTLDHGRSFVRAWLVCGEFPNPARPGAEPVAPNRLGLGIDYLKEQGGEAGIVPVAGMAHTRPDGTKAEWKPQTFSWDIVDLTQAFPGRPTENVVAYAFATVARRESGPVVLGLGSDDGVKVWINGRLVHEYIAERAARADEDLVEVALKAGENRILVKVEQGTGGWGFLFRVMDVAEARDRARDALYPAILPAEGEHAGKLAVLTNRMLASLDATKPPVEVEVIAPGGVAKAAATVARGETALFNPGSWANGPYEVVCRMTAADGREVAAYVPWFKGDALEAARRLVESAAQADPDTSAGMVHAMLADMVRDKLGQKLDEVTPERLDAVHGTLMEFAEVLDAQAGGRGGARPRGMVRLAYRDKVDGSPQFCRAYLPSDYDPARKYPVIIDLHGYNPPNPPYVRWWGSDSRHDGTAERYGVITLYPHGRGNAWYRGIGDRDVVHSLDLAKQRLSVDEDRVYLMGYSMGGGGTWHVGTRHPELFAALGPYYGGWDYRVFLPEDVLARMTASERFEAEGDSSFAQAEQLLNLPVWVMHGDSDPVVDIAHSRYAVRMLQRWGYDVRYQEVPGGDHGLLRTEDALYQWFLQHQRNPDPKHVRVRAAQLKDASAYWVKVEQREDQCALIHADVEVTAPNEIRLDTDNVLAVTLSPGAPAVDPSRPLRVVWNTSDVRVVKLDASGRVSLRAEGYEPRGLVKTPELEGPASAANTTPFAIVMGTISPDPAMREVCRRHAETVTRNWEDWQHWRPPLFKDTEIADEDVQRYSLILVGGPDANLIAKRLMPQLPVTLSSDQVALDGRAFPARDAALQMVYPHPLNRERYVVLIAGTSAAGLYLAQGLPGNVDLCVADGRVPNEREGRTPEKVFIAIGRFDHAWRLNPAYLTVGDPQVRSQCALRTVPTRFSAVAEGDRLPLGELLETRAEGAFARMMRDRNWVGDPITLGGRTYASGIAVNTTDEPTAAEYDLAGGGWRRLRGVIGLEVLPEGRTSEAERKATGVRFVVRGNGKELYRSEPFTYGSGPRDLDVDIPGVQVLRLEVELTGAPGGAVLSVDWADLRLER